MRLTLALAAAAAVGVAGALILGEYPFKGFVVLASGVVFGLFIGEAALAVARRPTLALATACAAIGLAAMAWAAWITTGRDLSFLGPAGWVAIALTGATAGVRTGLSRRAAGSPPEGPAPKAPSEERPP